MSQISYKPQFDATQLSRSLTDPLLLASPGNAPPPVSLSFTDVLQSNLKPAPQAVSNTDAPAPSPASAALAAPSGLAGSARWPSHTSRTDQPPAKSPPPSDPPANPPRDTTSPPAADTPPSKETSQPTGQDAKGSQSSSTDATTNANTAANVSLTQPLPIPATPLPTVPVPVASSQNGAPPKAARNITPAAAGVHSAPAPAGLVAGWTTGTTAVNSTQTPAAQAAPSSPTAAVTAASTTTQTPAAAAAPASAPSSAPSPVSGSAVPPSVTPATLPISNTPSIAVAAPTPSAGGTSAQLQSDGNQQKSAPQAPPPDALSTPDAANLALGQSLAASVTAAAAPIATNHEVAHVQTDTHGNEVTPIAGAAAELPELSTGRTSQGRAASQTKGANFPHAGEIVEQAFHGLQIAHRDGHTVQVRLQPPELGALQIDVSMKDGVLVAKLETQTPAAQQVLTDNLSQLKDTLTQQGLHVDRIEVTLSPSAADNQRGGSAPNFSNQQSSGQQQGMSREQPNAFMPLREDQAAQAPVPRPHAAAARQPLREIDVRV